MKIIKVILKGTIGILIVSSLLGLILLYLISNTILNKEFIFDKMGQNNYYDNLYSDIINQMESYIGPSGLDERILEDIVTREKVKSDVNLFIESIYQDKELHIEIEDIKNKLEFNINEYLKEEKLKVSSQENLEEFKNKIIQEYQKEITYNTYSKKLKKIPFEEIAEIIQITKIAVTVILVATCGGYLLLSKKIFKKNISELMTFFLACGIIANVVTIWINIRLKIENITILNDAVSIMLRNIIKDILSQITSIGTALLILSFLFIILANTIIIYKRNNN